MRFLMGAILAMSLIGGLAVASSEKKSAGKGSGKSHRSSTHKKEASHKKVS
jgi:hypothetical protein